VIGSPNKARQGAACLLAHGRGVPLCCGGLDEVQNLPSEAVKAR